MTDRKKQISKFVYVPNKGLWVDFKDKAMAVRVTPNEGDVLIAEGDGPDRLDRACIPGKTVIKFECDSFMDEVEIRVWFNAIDGKDWHLVGVTDDVGHAKKWVDRVNDIYERRRGASGNTIQEQKNHGLVIRDIEINGETNVLPGDFVYSAETNRPIVPPRDYLYDGGNFPTTRLPAWQEQYLKLCLDEAMAKADYRRPIKVKIGTSPIHEYLWLADRVKYESFQTPLRITQPLEIMFDCQERHKQIKVVPFCTIPRFALVYVRGRESQRMLNLAPGELAANTFDEWIAKTGAETLQGGRVQLCIPAEQAVQYPLKDAVFKGRIDPRQITVRSTPNEMARWLYENPKLGIIVCDVGVFFQILYDSKQSEIPLSPIDYSLVPYEKVLKGGFCYRSDDSTWGGICAKAFDACLNAKDARVVESLVEFQSFSKKVGIEFPLLTD